MLFWNFFFVFAFSACNRNSSLAVCTVCGRMTSGRPVAYWQLFPNDLPTDISYLTKWSYCRATGEMVHFFTIWLLRTNQSLVLFWFWKKKNSTIRPLSHIVICQSPSFNIQSSFHMHISKSEKLKNKTSTSVAHKQIMYLITRDWYLLGRRLCENKKHKEWPNHIFHFTVSHSVVPLKRMFSEISS